MGESLRPHLKFNNLFVASIPREVSYINLRATLEKIGGSNCKVVIPQDYTTKEQIGSAYLNYNTVEEARRVLDKYRHKIIFNGQMCKLMYAPQKSQADKDRVFGPYSYKFQVIVKNLSETVDTPALFEHFRKYGEILQCKTDMDIYKQHYGQVTYLDEASVAKAVAGANGVRWDSSVISVEAHHKAYLAANVPGHEGDGGGSSAGGAGTPTAAAANGHGSSGAGSSRMLGAPQQMHQQHQQHQQQHQQQQHKQHQQQQHQHQQQFQQHQHQHQQPQAPHSVYGAPSAPPRGPVNFAVQAMQDGGAAGGGSSLTGLTALQTATSAEVDAAAAVTAMDVARLVLSEGSGSSLPSPAASARAASGTNAAAAIAAAAGLPNGPLFDLLQRRRVATPASGASAAGGGALPSPVLARAGLPPTPGSASPLRQHAPSAAAAPPAGAAGGRGVLKSLTQALASVADRLCCPITHDPFVDPVVAADGVTYERAAITEWLAGKDTSPMTNVRLPNKELHPNALARQLVELLL